MADAAARERSAGRRHRGASTMRLWTRVLPEWEHTCSRPQRNSYHTYTVDRHLVEAAAERPPSPAGSSVRPPRDRHPAARHRQGPAGRPHGRRHGAGARSARGWGSPPVTSTPSWPSSSTTCCCPTSRPGDLDTTSARSTLVAKAVGDLPTLQLLAALTEGDSPATGPAAWGGWKAQLVSELVGRTGHVLAGGNLADAARPVPHRRALRPDGRWRAGPRRSGRHPHGGHGRQARGVHQDRGRARPARAGGARRQRAQLRRGRRPGPVPRRVQLRARDPVGSRTDDLDGPPGRLALTARLHDRARTYASRRSSSATPVRTGSPSTTASAVAHRHRRARPDSVGLLHRVTGRSPSSTSTSGRPRSRRSGRRWSTRSTRTSAARSSPTTGSVGRSSGRSSTPHRRR